MQELHSNCKRIEPPSLGSPCFQKQHCAQFQSPVQFVQNSANQKQSIESPQEQIEIKYTHYFRNIIQRDNEDGSQQDHQEYYESTQNLRENQNIDILGNPLPICQFYIDDRNDQCQDIKNTVIEDKQNSLPHSTSLYTPMKTNKDDTLRSPLRDITPSLTKKYKKSALTTISAKSYLFTPGTLSKSRLSGSGLRRIERL